MASAHEPAEHLKFDIRLTLPTGLGLVPLKKHATVPHDPSPRSPVRHGEDEAAAHQNRVALVPVGQRREFRAGRFEAEAVFPLRAAARRGTDWSIRLTSA